MEKFNTGSAERNTSLFGQPAINPVAQLAVNVAEGLEGFDRLVMKQLLAYELKESFYFTSNQENDTSPFIAALVRISGKSPVSGYNVGLAALSKAVTTCEREHSQIQLLLGCWNDLKAYADRYDLHCERVRDHILALSEDQIRVIVQYLLAME